MITVGSSQDLSRVVAFYMLAMVEKGNIKMEHVWINEKDFYKLDVINYMTCNTIVKFRRRATIKPLVKREDDGTYSVRIPLGEVK
jgi:hypothetical protein